jgi:hypothetical protein
MTRRSSVRAQARRIYRDRKQAIAADPPSPGGFGGQGLTARARSLYEDSALPVREIAALAGVSERTIYKYAAKGAWKPRYRWSPDRGWRAEAAFAPAQGAGARFIRREDKGKPFATGLKALDPAGAARAALECQEAERVARAAQAEAEAELATDTLCRAFDMMRAATRQLADYVAERRAHGAARPTRLDELRERALFMACEHATQNVEHTAAAWQQAELRARAG